MLAKELRNLSKSEKPLLIHDLQDNLPSELDEAPLRVEEEENLDKRYAAFRKSPDQHDSWETVRARLENR
ncbi:MAG: addiction module protein [Opitutales bacterium]